MTLLAALPYVAAFVTQQLNGWHSDRTGERRWHAAIPVFLCALALSLAVLNSSRPLAHPLRCSCASWGAFYGFQPCHPRLLPALFLSESAAAASIRADQFSRESRRLGFGPTVMGYLVGRTHNFSAGLWYLVGSLITSGMLMLAVGAGRRREVSDTA